MGAAETTMEARLAATMASLSESRALLASCARRLGLKEQEREATMTTYLLAPDPVSEKPETKPSSPSFVSADWVVAAGALHGSAVVTPTMPTRCSTLGPAVNVGNKPAVFAFPASGTTHLPATTPIEAGNNTQQPLSRQRKQPVPSLPWNSEQIMDTHRELEGKIDKPTHLEHGIGGVRLVLLAALPQECKLQQLLLSGIQYGCHISSFSLSWDPGGCSLQLDLNSTTLIFSWDPGVWTIFPEIPELSTPRTIGTRRLNQLQVTLSEDIVSMKRKEQLWLQVRQLATQNWDPGILRFACTYLFACYLILVCRCLLYALLRQTSQLPTQTSETYHAFLAYSSLIKACRMQLQAAHWAFVLTFITEIRMFYSQFWIKGFVGDFSVTVNRALYFVTFSMEKLFRLVVSPLDMFQEIYMGSVCMVVGEFKAPKQHIFVEVQMICRSAHIFLVEFSLIDESSAATDSNELFQCVNWQYHIGQRHSLIPEGMVHRNQQQAVLGCYFHMQSSSFGLNVLQLCCMSTPDGMPWDPGGINGSGIRAIAWGQAMFCRGGSVTPVLDYVLGQGMWALGPMDRSVELVAAYKGKQRQQSEGIEQNRNRVAPVLSLPSPTSVSLSLIFLMV